MFLRSLMGPEDLLYMFYDDPGLIHDCLQTWCELTDQIVAHTQQHISLDELFIGEDICYNNGPLISPEMIEEFLMPYYRIVVGNARKRQIDPQRKLHVQVDTDGKAMPVIDLYAKHIGMDCMSPFEVASGCDVVQIGKDYPDLIMIHGIDKRILAKSKEAIDAELQRIIPVMKARGGYIPACDHGVPAEVSLENYLHYRKRMVELGG
jgi:uroporphyrinogen decarboxylase